jgi:endoglucanase
LITIGAINTHNTRSKKAEEFETLQRNKRTIKDGMDNGEDLISDDGQIGNPKSYPDLGCELPNYLSKDGKIIAESKNGTQVIMGIKGVNWFGMETGVAIPFGLWENAENGTSVYEVAAFLSRNKFNSVRLPVCIQSILKNTRPQEGLVNLATNRAMNLKNYMTTLSSIIEALAYRRISVMISIHTLSTMASGGSWYDAGLGVSENDFLKAIDTLTTNLCNKKHWNILGLDLKNEPYKTSWGGGAPDWVEGAQLIANRMHKECPNWLAFVEGVNGNHQITLNGVSNIYFDWWGGGLQKALVKPIELANPDKIVWAPHYYNTGVDPTWYFYKSGTKSGDRSYQNFVELDDETLKSNIEATMEDMFAFLTKEKKYAMVMGEFAGLYATDKHPMKTTKRTTDFTIDIMLEKGFAGAYMWSLNPESAYQFNPADTYGQFTEGLLLNDWLSPDKEFLEGMAKMDKFENLKPFPCFREETS